MTDILAITVAQVSIDIFLYCILLLVVFVLQTPCINYRKLNNAKNCILRQKKIDAV